MSKLKAKELICKIINFCSFSSELRMNVLNTVITILVAIIIFIIGYEKNEKRIIKKVFIKESKIVCIIILSCLCYILEAIVNNKSFNYIISFECLLIIIDFFVSFISIIKIIKLCTSENYYYNKRNKYIQEELAYYEDTKNIFKDIKGELRKVASENNIKIDICELYGKKEYVFECDEILVRFDKKKFLNIVKENNIQTTIRFKIFNNNSINRKYFITVEGLEENDIVKCFTIKRIKEYYDENIKLIFRELLTNNKVEYISKLYEYIMNNHYDLCDNVMQKELHDIFERRMKNNENIIDLAKLYEKICFFNMSIDLKDRMDYFEAYFNCFCLFYINAIMMKNTNYFNEMDDIIKGIMRSLFWNVLAYQESSDMYDYALSRYLIIITAKTYINDEIDSDFFRIERFNCDYKYDIYNYQFLLALIELSLNNIHLNKYKCLLKEYLNQIKLKKISFIDFMKIITTFEKDKTKVYNMINKLPLFSEFGHVSDFFNNHNKNQALFLLLLIQKNIDLKIDKTEELVFFHKEYQDFYNKNRKEELKRFLDDIE